MICGEPCKPPRNASPKRVCALAVGRANPASQKLFQKYSFAGGILANHSRTFQFGGPDLGIYCFWRLQFGSRSPGRLVYLLPHF